MSDGSRFSIRDVEKEKEKFTPSELWGILVALLCLPFVLLWKLLKLCFSLVMVIPLSVVQTFCAFLLTIGDKDGGALLGTIVIQVVVLGLCLASRGLLEGLGLFVLLMFVIWPIVRALLIALLHLFRNRG